MYHFVFETPKPADSSEDRRRAELQDSDARSHAAKIAYLKKLARQRIGDEYDYSATPRRHNGAKDDVAVPVVPSDINKSRGRSGSVASAERQSEPEPEPEPPNELDARRRNATNAPRRQSCPGPTKSKGKSKGKGKGNRIYSRAKFRVEPWSVLAQTSKDPFDAFPERRLPENVERVVQYGESASESASESESVSCPSLYLRLNVYQPTFYNGDYPSSTLHILNSPRRSI
jgi:hypothetical protein